MHHFFSSRGDRTLGHGPADTRLNDDSTVGRIRTLPCRGLTAQPRSWHQVICVAAIRRHGPPVMPLTGWHLRALCMSRCSRNYLFNNNNHNTAHSKTNSLHSFCWHVQNVTIPCCSQELLPFLSVMYFLLPPFSTNYSSILSHFILPSISWSTFQSCCSQSRIICWLYLLTHSMEQGPS